MSLGATSNRDGLCLGEPIIMRHVLDKGLEVANSLEGHGGFLKSQESADNTQKMLKDRFSACRL